MITPDLNAPEWINKGCKDVKELCGIGIASTLGDYALGRREAEGFARVDLKSTIETYVGYLMKTYKERITSGNPNEISLMGKTEEAMKTVVGGTITGSRIVDRWEHPTKNMIFVLAKIDLEAFKNNVDQMRGLSEKFKEYVRKNAERMHEELNKELKEKGE
tara:strand:- start:339 stop:821 length:483 start_codon:yes stop_codon:yes gene_type:complete